MRLIMDSQPHPLDMLWGQPAVSSNTTTSWGGWKRIAAPPTVMGKIWGQQQSFIWLLFVLLLDHPAC